MLKEKREEKKEKEKQEKYETCMFRFRALREENITSKVAFYTYRLTRKIFRDNIERLGTYLTLYLRLIVRIAYITAGLQRGK